VLTFCRDPTTGVDGSDSKKATFAKQMLSPMVVIMAAANKQLNRHSL